MTGDPVKSLTG